MTTNLHFNFNDVAYSTKEDFENGTIDFFIQNPRKTKNPESLYKYYRVNNCAFKHSIDAFLNHYLFSSHPSNLNDKYDCSGDLIDYSNLSLEKFISKLSKELHIIPEDKVRQTYNSNNKRYLDSSLAELYQTILFMKFGVISLTEKPNDVLMWGYYAENSGFALKFRTSLLPNHFFGPFPINYAETLKKIDYTKFNQSVCILYQSNVKHSFWKHENEWRYLTYNKFGKYHPMYAYSDDDKQTRKFDYDPNAVEEVILGYDFFNIKEIEFDKRAPEFDIINISKNKLPNDWKLKFLEYIVNNSIQCSQIIRHRDSVNLEVVEIEIKKVSNYEFKFINPFKNVGLF